MNPSYFIFIFLIVIVLTQNRQAQFVARQHIHGKKQKGADPMKELATRFIGKECILYAFQSQLTGTIKEVSQNAILLENNGVMEAVNLDFVVRIREYPKKKNGKKKSVVLD